MSSQSRVALDPFLFCFQPGAGQRREQSDPPWESFVVNFSVRTFVSLLSRGLGFNKGSEQPGRQPVFRNQAPVIIFRRQVLVCHVEGSSDIWEMQRENALPLNLHRAELRATLNQQMSHEPPGEPRPSRGRTLGCAEDQVYRTE